MSGRLLGRLDFVESLRSGEADSYEWHIIEVSLRTRVFVTLNCHEEWVEFWSSKGLPWEYRALTQWPFTIIDSPRSCIAEDFLRFGRHAVGRHVDERDWEYLRLDAERIRHLLDELFASEIVQTVHLWTYEDEAPFKEVRATPASFPALYVAEVRARRGVFTVPDVHFTVVR